MATNLHSLIARHRDLSEEAQRRAGQAIAGSMGDEHKNFLETVCGLIDSGAIDVRHPETFLDRDVYDHLSEEWKAKIDRALVNIADLLRHIEAFYRSKQTPNESPHLQTMIEQLWQMKQRIETHHNVFKF